MEEEDLRVRLGVFEVQEFRYVRRIVGALKVRSRIKVNAISDREPVKDRSDVIHGGGSCDDASLRMDLRRRPKRRVLH